MESSEISEESDSLMELNVEPIEPLIEKFVIINTINCTYKVHTRDYINEMLQ